jgi:lycopene elongase/hydratase (dihydrobisanhydrobacterioruberin-forming)
MSDGTPGNAARAAGYRLLGGRLDYLLHLRPAEWPIVAAHTAVGALVAVGFAGIGAVAPAVAGGLALWVVCLNGGTLAVNSAFDRDTSDIAYLRRPPPPPRYLFPFGLGLMLAGLVLAGPLPAGFRAAYALCLGLSVAYSVPPLRLKAVAGLDWLINMWGFGTLTPYAGWALTGAAVTDAGRAVLLACCPLFAGLYPLTQLYQLDDDRARGDRTMALVLGVRGSLWVAAAAVTLAFAVLVVAGLRSPWGPADGPALRWLGLAVAAGAWAAVLGPWLRAGPALSASGHQRGMYRALGAWAVTDLAVLYAFAR